VRAAAAYLAPLRLAIPFEIVPSSFPQRAVPRPWRPETPEALPSPILRRLSRLRSAAPRLAVRSCGVRPPRAGGAASAAREQRLPAEAGGGSGGAKMLFGLPILLPILSSPHP
jgi:hypothetical protein